MFPWFWHFHERVLLLRSFFIGAGHHAQDAGEPVWAGVFGRIAGERLPLLALFGGCLVVLGVLVSELKFKILEKKKES